MSKPTALSAILCLVLSFPCGASAPVPDPNGDLIPTKRVEPRFPHEALVKRISGWVRVAGTVAADGSVLEVHVVESAPPGMFDDSALRAVKGWQFKPRIVEGAAVARPFEQTIKYNIEGGAPPPPASAVVPPPSMTLLPAATVLRLDAQVATAWARDPAAIEAVYQSARAFCPDRQAPSADPADAFMFVPPVATLPATLADQPTRVNHFLFEVSRCLFSRIAHLRDPATFSAAAAFFSPQVWDDAPLLGQFVALAPTHVGDTNMTADARKALDVRAILVRRYFNVVGAATLREVEPRPDYVGQLVGRRLSAAQDDISSGDFAAAEAKLKALLPKAGKPIERALIQQNLGNVALESGRSDDAILFYQAAIRERGLSWSNESKIDYALLQLAYKLDRPELFDQTLASIRERVVLPEALRL
jgi:TonB family protein